MGADLRIGGAPMVTLRCEDPPADGPAFLEAQVLPGRGMMLLQAKLRLPDGEVTNALFAPEPGTAARELSGGPEDFAGNKAFSFGGAILAPFANRIRGRALAGTREIEATVAGRTVRLPRNWGGRGEGAEQYAMHGLILDAQVAFEQPAPGRATGVLEGGGFAGRWPGEARLAFEWRLAAGRLHLSVAAENTGATPLPIGIGWHPYFRLPSGDRRQAKLRLPARARALVNNYDEVLPTGDLQPLAGTAYDFGGPAGRTLGDLYLDDCFTDLVREHGFAVAEVLDPAARLGLRISSPTPEVSAFQVYAPPDQAFVVVEPQFNLADPYSSAWRGHGTGMATVFPGEHVVYQADVTSFALRNR